MPSKTKKSQALRTHQEFNLIGLPKEVLTNCLLPLLDHFTLGRVAQTCNGLRSAVQSFLETNRVLNMIPTSRVIETGELSMAGVRKKAAFIFLTKSYSVNCLRKLFIDDHPAMPVASVANIKKLIKRNRNLEELILVNIKLSSAMLDDISKLPKLKSLKLSPDICVDKEDKFSDYMESIEKRGCDIQFHYNFF